MSDSTLTSDPEWRLDVEVIGLPNQAAVRRLLRVLGTRCLPNRLIRVDGYGRLLAARDELTGQDYFLRVRKWGPGNPRVDVSLMATAFGGGLHRKMRQALAKFEMSDKKVSRYTLPVSFRVRAKDANYAS